ISRQESTPDSLMWVYLTTDCREELYPCTRMYSVHRPLKRCIGGVCLYSLPRVYVINKEICTRTVCRQDEYLKGRALPRSSLGAESGACACFFSSSSCFTHLKHKPQTRG
uniref:Microfibril associated protein 5 n=1 Tax=Cynoglossus semilaevis TaxID=244447 RepID=A0A3P8WWI8_CYNSE